MNLPLLRRGGYRLSRIAPQAPSTASTAIDRFTRDEIVARSARVEFSDRVVMAVFMVRPFEGNPAIRAAGQSLLSVIKQAAYRDWLQIGNPWKTEIWNDIARQT